LKKYIANFITDEKNTNPDILVNVINTNENLRRLIFQGMDRYILTEDDIFDIEENEKFIILKGLMDTNIIEKNKNYENESENYIKKTITLLSNIFKKLKQFDIGYRTISIFMITEENEGKLKNIIYYICYKDLLDQSEKIMSELKIKFLKIKEVINKYEKLLNNFNYFFQGNIIILYKI
jgi:hypothetical protein